jgi:hypothetical protein
MAGGPEDHFTDSRELYVLVEGDEWAHVEALDPDAGYWARRFAQLVNWRAGRDSRDRAVVPSAAELVEQLKEIARRGRRARSPRASSRQSRRGCSRTKPRLKKLVRRPQWTRSTSRERHIGRRVHSSPGGTRAVASRPLLLSPVDASLLLGGAKIVLGLPERDAHHCPAAAIGQADEPAIAALPVEHRNLVLLHHSDDVVDPLRRIRCRLSRRLSGKGGPSWLPVISTTVGRTSSDGSARARATDSVGRPGRSRPWGVQHRPGVCPTASAQRSRALSESAGERAGRRKQA